MRFIVKVLMALVVVSFVLNGAIFYGFINNEVDEKVYILISLVLNAFTPLIMMGFLIKLMIEIQRWRGKKIKNKLWEAVKGFMSFLKRKIGKG